MAFCMSDDYLSASSKFYEYMINNHKDDYKYSVITDKKINYEGFSTSYHLYSLKGIYELLTSKYVVFAQRLQFFDVLNSPRHIYINLWHGMPIKKLALTRREENSKSAIRQLSLLGKHALFFATSDLFKQLMISCFLCDYKRVFVTGLARNDYIGDHTNDE
ncbi:CDP-glycerol glycerophosphotransferase family protein, partial [bacterium]|nr:CDP-glycerol glycerophosphotransferase family protein [bacterium]